MASPTFSSTTQGNSYQLSHVSMPNESRPGVQEGSLTRSIIKRPRLGSLWRALRSVRVTALLYSSLVAVLGSLSFGYGMGFSSPALVDLEDSNGKHTSFNKTIYSDTFNVSVLTYHLFIFAGHILLNCRHLQQLVASLVPPWLDGWWIIMDDSLQWWCVVYPSPLAGY